MGEGFRAALGREQDSAQKMLATYQKNSATMTAAAKDKAEKDLQAIEADLQTKNQQFQQQFDAKRQEVMAPISDLVKTVLDGLLTDGCYAMILDNAPGASNIVAADKNLDITDKAVSQASRDPGAEAQGDTRRRRAGQGSASRPRGCDEAAGQAADAVIAGSGTTSSGGEGGFALTAAAIAEGVGGRLVGDPTVVVGGIAPLDRASERHLSFLGAPKYASMFTASAAGVVLDLARAGGDAGPRAGADRGRPAARGAPGAAAALSPGAAGRARRSRDVGDRARRAARPETCPSAPYAIIGDGVVARRRRRDRSALRDRRRRGDRRARRSSTRR